MRQEGKSVLGQGRLPCCSVEQSGPQLFLKRRQPGARTCRGEGQIAGGRADAPELRDAQKQVQVVDFHWTTFKISLKLILNETGYRGQ